MKKLVLSLLLAALLPAAAAGARAGGPAAPTGVSASDGTYTDRIRVSWNASDGAASYAVYRSGSVSGEKTVAATTLGTSIDDTGSSVLPGMTYYYWVTARNQAGESGFGSYDTGWKQIHNIAPYSVFRFYSKNYKGHFFTIDETEKDDLIANNPNWKYEGIAFYALPAADANAEAPASAPGGKGVQRALRDAHAVAWTLAADGTAIAMPGVTEAGGVFVEARLDAPDAEELAARPAVPDADELALRLSLPGGAFDASLWSAADGTVAEGEAEAAFVFGLPATGVWHWLRVRGEDGADAFYLWLRAE